MCFNCLANKYYLITKSAYHFHPFGYLTFQDDLIDLVKKKDGAFNFKRNACSFYFENLCWCYFYTSVSPVLWCRLDWLIAAGSVTKTTISAGIPTCAHRLRANNIELSEAAWCQKRIYYGNDKILHQLQMFSSVLCYVGLKLYIRIVFVNCILQ